MAPPEDYDWLVLLQPSLASTASVDGASDKCLLITDAYGRLMQVVLAFTALVVMYIKRKLETPMRPLRVWALDVSKQCCGAFLIHCTSILLSVVFVAAADNGDDECGVYFVTFMLDTTWGVVVILLMLQLEHALAVHFGWRDLIESGFYGDPPRLFIWGKQVVAYACAVLTMKLIDSLLILWYYHEIATFATNLFRSFSNHRHLELLLVMIIIPGCCNSFQFWIVDSFLKCDGSRWKAFTSFITSDDEEPRKSVVVSPLSDEETKSLIVEKAAPPQLLPAPLIRTVISYETTNPSTPLVDTQNETTPSTTVL